MLERRIPIRWRDMDAYGHVNNAVYLTYLEEARDAWVAEVLGPVTDTWDFVLARVALDFRSELTQDDDAVIVSCRLRTIGRSSLTTLEEIRKLDGTLSASAESVTVPRDKETGKARKLSDNERAILEKKQPTRPRPARD